jgi:hypothetical protein
MHFAARMRNRLPAIAAGLLAAACEPTAPALTPENIAGTYVLESINGQPLPASGTFGGRLSLDANGAFTETLITGVTFERHGSWFLLHDATLRLENTESFVGPPSTATVEGNRIILCSSADIGGDPCQFRRAYVRFVSEPKVINSVYLQPDSLLLWAGARVTVTAVAVPYTFLINVFVRDTAIAAMDASGTISAKRPGRTYIIATAGTARDSTILIVAQPYFDLSPDSVSFALGSSSILRPNMYYYWGSTNDMSIFSADTTIARVAYDPSIGKGFNQRVTGVRAGTTYVIAEHRAGQLGTFRDSTKVIVY